jgi:hypothetical protein
MFENFANIVIELVSVFERAPDPLLDEYRNCLRQMIVGYAIAVLGFFGSIVTTWLAPAVSVMLNLYNNISLVMGMIFAAVTLISSVFSLWATYRVLNFSKNE